jgi:Ran GTPase-activating protein (RanGAP) involved in mRNA processing and transport
LLIKFRVFEEMKGYIVKTLKLRESILLKRIERNQITKVNLSFESIVRAVFNIPKEEEWNEYIQQKSQSCLLGEKSIIKLCKALSYNNSLQRLNISWHSLTPMGSLRILQSIEGNQQLQALNLSGNILDDNCLNLLAKRLANNTPLHTLRLNGCGIGEGIDTLINALKTNTVLHTLELDRNQLEGYGEEIAELIKISKTLRNLDIAYNDFSAEDIDAIIEALRDNTILQGLDLGGNQITDITTIAQALQDNISISYLRLDDNNIGTEGALTVFEALRSNHNLRFLELDDNKIDDNCSEALANLLMENDSIVSIILDGNPVGDRVGQILLDFLKGTNIFLGLDLEETNISIPILKQMFHAAQTHPCLFHLTGLPEMAEFNNKREKVLKSYTAKLLEYIKSNNKTLPKEAMNLRELKAMKIFCSASPNWTKLFKVPQEHRAAFAEFLKQENYCHPDHAFKLLKVCKSWETQEKMVRLPAEVWMHIFKQLASLADAPTPLTEIAELDLSESANELAALPFADEAAIMDEV